MIGKTTRAFVVPLVCVALASPPASRAAAQATAGCADWKQVWITENASVPGGTKEKRLTGRTEDGGVRFQGRIRRADGSTWLDRTTLTPAAEGRVRQHIEGSADEGATWRTTFDAWYVRVPARANHYEGASGETVVLFTGTGPLRTNRVEQGAARTQ